MVSQLSFSQGNLSGATLISSSCLHLYYFTMGRKRFASPACWASGRESNQPTRCHVYFWSVSRSTGRRDGAGDGVDGPWMGRACGVSRPKPVSRFHRSGRLTSERPFLPPLHAPLHSTINLLSETQFAPFLRGRGSPCKLNEDENPLQNIRCTF